MLWFQTWKLKCMQKITSWKQQSQHSFNMVVIFFKLSRCKINNTLKDPEEYDEKKDSEESLKYVRFWICEKNKS